MAFLLTVNSLIFVAEVHFSIWSEIKMQLSFSTTQIQQFFSVLNFYFVHWRPHSLASFLHGFFVLTEITNLSFQVSTLSLGNPLSHSGLRILQVKKQGQNFVMSHILQLLNSPSFHSFLFCGVIVLDPLAPRIQDILYLSTC